MTLALRETIRAGVDRAFTRNGFVLIVTFLGVSILQVGFIWLVATTYLPLGSGTPVISTQRAGPTPGTTPSFIVTVVSVILVSVTGGFLTIPVQIVAVRTMVSRHTRRIPDEFVFHNMGWAVLHTLFGTWLTILLVGALAIGGLLLSGFFLFRVMGHSTQLWLVSHWVGWVGIGLFSLVLLLPSIFLYISVVFICHEISIKDKNMIEAITGSWRCCRGNRLRLLGVVLITYSLSFVVSLFFNVGLRIGAGLDPMVVQGVVIVALSIVQIVIVAILARAYVAVNDDSLTIAAENSPLSD